MASVQLFRGNPGAVISLLENASAAANDWYAGDLVKSDSSGTVVIATAGQILGIARETCAGDDLATLVELINHDSIYKAYYKASAITTALIGDVVDFTFTAGAHTLDESGATTDAMVVELIDAVNTSGGALGIRFIPAAHDDNR